VWRVATRYTAPWVPGKGHELVMDGLLREVAQEPTFRIQRSGLRVGIRSKFGTKVETFIDYNAQVRKLEDLDPGALVPGDPWLPFLDLDNEGNGELSVPSENRFQTGPEILFLVDGRNDRFNPTQGAYLSMQGQLVDRIQSDAIMFRGDLRLETFVGVGPIIVDWFGRVAGGRAAGAGNTLPIEDRFYLGGAGSMRGFRLNSVGPANFSARPNLAMPGGIDPAVEGKALRNTPGHWVWTGGDSLFQTTLELRVPLSAVGLEDWDSTNIFLFSDVGQVQMLDDSVVTSSAARGLNRPYRYGVGAGIRVATPIGPAAIAIGVNPDPIGAWEEPQVLPHITLGEL
jgi:outer membrane protein assembly factor BamA